ncbi:DUF4442 domain-containing protein [Litorilituus lipolyticus]|uniref:DUF4442 domain-containing protein n=1 Tax=Litorilituus lipolyticus TaxID=2491017 RepID=A0A502L5H5_9GAMM|nr:DUF4442 domain-containing protein [Litorilituus lipolyticus]TPH15547.1 DUF4442 domain-containing protein [Litorilituus lipolyticus]
MPNQLSRMVNKINKFSPEFIKPWLLTKLFCSQVKYANTTGIDIREISHDNVVIKLANKKRVQNHIGGVHAVAAALLAESASGIVFGINLPSRQLPLLKSMKLNFNRRMQGALTATATLTAEQHEQIKAQDKGDMLVSVVITDESGEEPIECEMDWAWVTKR